MSWEQECNLARFQRSLTDCNSALLPVKYLFMSGEGNRVSGRKIQRKANSEKRWNSETSSAAQLCVKEERDAVFVWGVLGPSNDLLTPHPPRIPSYTCSPLWQTLLKQIMTLLPQLLPLERYTSAALCYKTKSHPCMLLHAVHTLIDFILLYWICITQFLVNLKINCSCWRGHFTCVSEVTLDKGSILWPKM